MPIEIANDDNIITKVPECNVYLKDDNELWEKVCHESNSQIAAVEDYKINKIGDIPTHPICDYMNKNIFNILNGVLETTLIKARDSHSLKYQKSPFNAIDFIAEQLWNFNPNYPDRRTKYVSIHDMEWAKKIMKEVPRPHFPFSYIWSRHFAATKIQAYVKGYWIRKRDDIQEMRLFWKAIQKEKAQCSHLNP